MAGVHIFQILYARQFFLRFLSCAFTPFVHGKGNCQTGKQKQKNINKIDTIKLVQEKLDSSIQIRASGLSKDSTKRIIQTLWPN